jgi:hypothetical protein
LALFPDLSTGTTTFPAARPTLNHSEAQALLVA